MSAATKLNPPVSLPDDVVKIINTCHSKKGKFIASIPTHEILNRVYGNVLPHPNSSFHDILQTLHDQTIDSYKEANKYLRSQKKSKIELPKAAAFNNCNGSWAEYCYSAYVWNYLAELNRSSRNQAGNNPYTVYIFVKLPNRNSNRNEWTQLFVPNITNELTVFPTRQSARIIDPNNSNYQRRFEMISSNPDFVILKFDNDTAQRIWTDAQITGIDFYQDIIGLNLTVMAALDSLFTAFSGTVLPSTNLQCFLSVKTSTRPDRRYQWVHEADHVKTILQWIQAMSAFTAVPLDQNLTYNDLNGKFFAISLSKVTDSDQKVKDIGLVGSIITPNLDPVWAIDNLFDCIKPSDVPGQIHDMINF